MSTTSPIVRRAAALVSALALAAMLPASALGAIVRDATSVNVGTGISLTVPHTVGIGADRVMIVGLSIYNANKQVTDVSYAGQPMTRLGFQDGGSGSNDRRMEMWRLIDPPPGTANVVVNFTSSSKAVIGVVSFFGVDTTTPNGTFVSNGAKSTTATLTVPSAPGELVIDCMSAQGNAATATAGPGQTQLWNDYTRENGGAVVGTSSTEPGAASVSMTWGLASSEYWVIGAVSLKPSLRTYQPDAMVKLSTEPDAAYFYNYYYENPFSLQIKSTSVLATVTASYRVRLENDGVNADRLVVTGTGSTTDFVVQYLDENGIDRTPAVTAGGYTTALMASATGVVWTMNITPQPTGTAGGTTYAANLTATSQTDPARSDQVGTQTTCVSPGLVMNKSVDLANAIPGQDIHYTLVAASTGLSNATAIVVVDSIPDYAGYQLGSATFNPGTSMLSSTISYSQDHGQTWGYLPGSGSCTAPGGYDYCVTHVRWTLTGAMPPASDFTLGMTVRVK